MNRELAKIVEGAQDYVEHHPGERQPARERLERLVFGDVVDHAVSLLLAGGIGNLVRAGRRDQIGEARLQFAHVRFLANE